MKLLVSACLLGVGCRYDGKNNQVPRLAELMKKHTCIPVCAEIFGGLPTPRVPAERRGSKVFNRDGEDVTEAFVRGTAEVLRLADLYGCKAALLKERSPSCGSHFVYDGTFTGTVVPGQGVTAALLAGRGVELFSEETIARLLLLYGPEEM